jgi:hypothetical protein
MRDLLRALCCVGRAVLVAGAVLYFVIDLLFLSLMMRAAFGRLFPPHIGRRTGISVAGGPV